MTVTTSTAPLDIYMTGLTFIICIINTFCSLTVDADGSGGMTCGALEGILSLSPAGKALAAGLFTGAGVLSAHHDITLAAKVVFIVQTTFN